MNSTNIPHCPTCGCGQKLGHDEAQAQIATHVREIEKLCDAFGYDPFQWLAEKSTAVHSAVDVKVLNAELCQQQGHVFPRIPVKECLRCHEQFVLDALVKTASEPVSASHWGMHPGEKS